MRQRPASCYALHRQDASCINHCTRCVGVLHASYMKVSLGAPSVLGFILHQLLAAWMDPALTMLSVTRTALIHCSARRCHLFFHAVRQGNCWDYYTENTINTLSHRSYTNCTISLVHPHLEYASPVWNPHLQKNINTLEDVQKFPLRMCSKC